MRRPFFYFIAIAFLLRGFVGDAMAVTMAHDVMNAQTVEVLSMASSMPDCHEMAPGDDTTTQHKAGSMNHAHCQLCCAVIGIPSAAFMTFDRAAFFARPVAFPQSFASNDPLPAFKPPIL